jgi:enoyl-CoA hydratase/carnithine racemase
MQFGQYETLDTAVENGILTVTLDRPEALNAFTVTMADELEHLFVSVNMIDAVRAIIVTGAGKAFCAGMDLTVPGNVFGLDESLSPTMTDMRDRLDDPQISRGVRDTGGRVTLAIYNCLKPVIAAIVGIGATMTLAMDFRIASTHARIGFVFGRIGITPEACSTWFLPKIVGTTQALEWFYNADILTPEEALRGGLVKEVVEPDSLLPAALALAHKIVDGRSTVSVALIRQMVYRNAAQPDPLEAHRVDSLAMFYTSIGDGKEGVAAFKEKRTPEFTAALSKDLPLFFPW